jgi:hypothetical protein
MLESDFAKWAAERSPFDPADPAAIQHCLYCFDSLYSTLKNKHSGRTGEDDYLLNNLEKNIGTSEL